MGGYLIAGARLLDATSKPRWMQHERRLDAAE